jgi:hypothetical protein
MLTKLRRTAWRDWLVPIQVLVGLSLLAIAVAEVPDDEASARAVPHAACASGAGCGAQVR